MDYRSKASLLGLPLIHVRTAEIVDGRVRRGVARGWVAVGDIAFGVVFSVGGVAWGGISLGGLAIAWQGALGGVAIAKAYALGGLAIAEHANDPEAQEFMRTSMVRFGRALLEHSQWFLILTIIP